MKNTKPKAKLIGANGNIFNLIGLAQRALEKEGLHERAEELFKEVHNNAQSYDEALQIIMTYVDVY